MPHCARCARLPHRLTTCCTAQMFRRSFQPPSASPWLLSPWPSRTHSHAHKPAGPHDVSVHSRLPCSLREVVASAIAASPPEVTAAQASRPRTAFGGSSTALQALGAAFAAHANNTDATSERRGAIFDALIGVEAEPARGEVAAVEAIDGLDPKTLLESIRWQLSQFATTREEDEAQLRAMAESDGGLERADPRLLAVLDYRLGRKRLLELTEAILSTLLGQ